jgi:hypothetical protein
MGRLTRNTSPTGEFADERFSKAFTSGFPYPDGAIFIGVDEPHFGAVFAEAVATRQPLVVINLDGQELIGRPCDAGLIFTRGPLASLATKGRKIYSHPLRIQILDLLHERTASPDELAKEVHESFVDVAYHFKVLSELGAIDLVRTEQARGAILHYYRISDSPQAPERTQE